MSIDISYAIKIDTDHPDLPCHISELIKGDRFYLVSGGKRGNLKIARSDAYRKSANACEEQWGIDCEDV